MKVIVQNIATEYSDEGPKKAPVMLMLHGWKDSLRTFDALTPALKKNWRVIRLDMPGFGKTEAPKATWTLTNYVEFVHDFIKKLDLPVEVLLGHSFGGRVIIKGLAKKTLKTHKVVFIAAAGFVKSRTLKNRLLKVLAQIGRAITCIPPFSFFRQSLRKKLYSAIGSDYLSTGSLKDTFLNVIQEDLAESAARITKPTLLIWGEEDTATPLADGKRLARIIEDSTFHSFPYAGHFVHQEKPDEVAALIQDFLAQ